MLIKKRCRYRLYNLPLEEVHSLRVKQEVGVAMKEVAPPSGDIRGADVL